MAFLDVLGAIASPIASLIGAGASAINMNQQKQLMQQNNEFQAAENQKNREWQSSEWQRQFDLTNAYNDPSEIVKRLKNAGLNASAMLSGSAGSGVGHSSALPSAPSGGTSASPSPDYSGVITSGFRSMNDIAQSIKQLTEARKTAKEIPYVGAMLDSQIEKNLAEMADAKAKAEFTSFQTELEKAFGVARRSKELARLESDILLAVQDIELKKSQGKFYDESALEVAAKALDAYASKHLKDVQANEISTLLSAKLNAYKASASRDIAEAGKLSAEASTENALRDYRVAISKAESLIKGNESKISDATWKDVVEQVRNAATASGLGNEEKLQDILLKGKNLDYRDAQEVRNWIKSIQGFIPLAPSIPME